MELKKTVISSWIVFFLLISCKPQESTTESGVPEAAEVTEVTDNEIPNVELPPSQTISDYLLSAEENASLIDNFYNLNELASEREKINEDRVDSCHEKKSFYSDKNYSERINYYVQKMLSPISSKVHIVGSYYGVSTSESALTPVSLMSHLLCVSTKESLSKTLKKVPSQIVINKLNVFENKVNSLSKLAKEGNLEAKSELIKIWGKLFSCLAYTESLSSANSSSSRSVASANSPAGYEKPNGVKFYNDPAQNEVSRLNIGMFQFTPNINGNIRTCVKAWNELYSGESSCSISEASTKGELIKILGSSFQSFNIFCGIHKIIQTFSVQVNTSSSSSTFPGNISKAKEDRCVTTHIHAGKAYNHFGPLQNSTGSNLNSLYSCLQ